MIFFALISAIGVCVTWAAELLRPAAVNGVQTIMRPMPMPGERWQEAQAALKQGHALILRGQYDEAEKILRPAVALSRGNADDIEQELSEISLRQGKYQEAYDLIDKVRPELGDGRRYARMAFLKAALGDYAGSKAMWDDAGPVRYIKDAYADDWPDIYTADGLKACWLLVIAELAFYESDMTARDHYLFAAEKLAPDNAIVTYGLAGRSYGRREFLSSEKLFEKAEHAAFGEQFRARCYEGYIDAQSHRIFEEKKHGDGRVRLTT